jgi:Chaperone of endosialidase
MADDIKRLNYFTNQFLVQEDFQAEQDYHRQMRHLHNQRSHTPGIVYGLEVTKKENTDRDVIISAGMAIDGDGQEIVVLEGGITHALSTTELTNLVYLSIAASDVDVDPYKGEGFTDKFTRKAERPKFNESSVFNPNTIVIAQLFLNNGKVEAVQPAAAGSMRKISTAAVAPSSITLDKLDPAIRPSTISNVSNPGGNIALSAANAISIIPDDAGNQITIGETHSARTNNPHGTTAAQVGALPLNGGTLNGRLFVNQDVSVGLFALPPVNGRVNVAGPSAEFSFARRTLTSWPAAPVPGDRFVWYNQDGNARLNTDGNGDLLTVTSTGNVGIGISPGFKLDVGGRMRVRQTASNGETAGIWFSGYYSGRGEIDSAFVGMKSIQEVGFYGQAITANGLAGDWRMYVNVASGNLTLTSSNAFKAGQGGPWGGLSDQRLKQNIRPLDSALDKLLSLRGVLYEWKKPEQHGNLTGVQMGMIAQDVEKVFPEWIDTNREGYKTLTIRGFEALTIEALRELKAENQALQRRCEMLESQLKHLNAIPQT